MFSDDWQVVFGRDNDTVAITHLVSLVENALVNRANRRTWQYCCGEGSIR
jgi:hypothetical protein